MKQFGKIQENRLSEIERKMHEIRSRLKIIDEFNEHCGTLITNGSPCDISCSANTVLAAGDDLIRSQNKFNDGVLSKAIFTFTAYDKPDVDINGPINLIGSITERRG